MSYRKKKTVTITPVKDVQASGVEGGAMFNFASLDTSRLLSLPNEHGDNSNEGYGSPTGSVDRRMRGLNIEDGNVPTVMSPYDVTLRGLISPRVSEMWTPPNSTGDGEVLSAKSYAIQAITQESYPTAVSTPNGRSTRNTNVCLRCRASKIRCSPFRPCRQCVKRGCDCVDAPPAGKRANTPKSNKKTLRSPANLSALKKKQSKGATPKSDFYGEYDAHVMSLLTQSMKNTQFKRATTKHWIRRCAEHNPKRSVEPDLSDIDQQYMMTSQMPMGVILTAMYPAPYHSQSKIKMNNHILKQLGYDLSVKDRISVASVCHASSLQSSIATLINAVDAMKECMQLEEKWIGKDGNTVLLRQNVIIKYDQKTSSPLFLIRWVNSVVPVHQPPSSLQLMVPSTPKRNAEKKRTTATNDANNNGRCAPMAFTFEGLSEQLNDEVSTPRRSSDDEMSVEYQPMSFETNILEQELMMNFDGASQWMTCL